LCFIAQDIELQTKAQSATNKIFIIGERDARGCAASLLHEYGDSFGS
jgi:hypothetical protein